MMDKTGPKNPNWHGLRMVAVTRHSDDPNSEDDVSDAENDATFWKVVVMALRGAREKAKP